MSGTLRSPAATAPGWLTNADCRLADLVALVDTPTDPADTPHARAVVDNVPLYDGDSLRARLGEPAQRRAIQAELARALMDGPGIVVLQRAFAEPSVIDQATATFLELIAEQHARGGAAGDHFAKPGANDRVWNALEKLGVRAPAVFVDYYANDLLALVSEAWLGPHYQVTSQVNVVNPGGAAQSMHRDYHLGFMAGDTAARYPAHVHRLSPVLTLQGAVAHGDMPIESGPTLYLPHSQKLAAGYLGWPRADFQALFAARRVQLPLASGDAVFFNPALYHAAGHNRTGHIRRMANLLQVSSAFGRAMESVDRERLSNAVFPALCAARDSGRLTAAQMRNAIAAAAEGYAFPTNLDRDQPLDGLAPPAQAQVVMRAVTEFWSPAQLRAALRAHQVRRMTD
jgi:ectoine hydroxylase-related dioxygenase (phytanoyl-CoA dioxygenase family)